MRREIFFQSVFVCLFVFFFFFLASSCRACRSWSLLQLPTRSSNSGRPLFPSSSPHISLSSPPLLRCPTRRRVSTPSPIPLFGFSIRIACCVSKIVRQNPKKKGALELFCSLYGDRKFPPLPVALFLAPLTCSCSCLFVSCCTQARSVREAAAPGWSSRRPCSCRGRNACPPRLTMHPRRLKRLAKRIT